MGMFDEIKLDVELPLKGFSDREFQTKDFQDWPTMAKLHVRANGQLWKAGGINERDENWLEFPYTGRARFYDFIDKPRGWIEFEAEFKSGFIGEIKVIENQGIEANAECSHSANNEKTKI